MNKDIKIGITPTSLPIMTYHVMTDHRKPKTKQMELIMRYWINKWYWMKCLFLSKTKGKVEDLEHNIGTLQNRFNLRIDNLERKVSLLMSLIKNTEFKTISYPNTFGSPTSEREHSMMQLRKKAAKEGFSLGVIFKDNSEIWIKQKAEK